MKVINRSAFTIRRLQPYLDWTSRTPPEHADIALMDLARISAVYLLPQLEDPSQSDAVVADQLAAIFAAELCWWNTDRTLWPESRGLDVFREWFQLDYADIVTDLGTTRIGAQLR